MSGSREERWEGKFYLLLAS